MELKTVRVFTNFDTPEPTWLFGRTADEFESHGIQVILNRSGKADLALVINTVTTPRWVKVPRGNLFKIVQEPKIHNILTHFFTYWHSKVFDKILTHSPDVDDPRQVSSLPYLGTWVDPFLKLDQLIAEKSKSLSIIASKLDYLPGHKNRLRFINNLLIRYPDLKNHTFGKGRERELTEKIDGLKPYSFSIAIENTSSDSYITEKFFDCICAGCIPLYYGAINVVDYFPLDSFVWLPISDEEKCFKIVEGLNHSEYVRRIPFLIEARSLIREKHSLGAMIINHLNSGIPEKPPQSRMVLLFRIDGLIQLVIRTGIQILKLVNFSKVK